MTTTPHHVDSKKGSLQTTSMLRRFCLRILCLALGVVLLVTTTPNIWATLRTQLSHAQDAEG